VLLLQHFLAAFVRIHLRQIAYYGKNVFYVSVTALKLALNVEKP